MIKEIIVITVGVALGYTLAMGAYFLLFMGN
jgi:hypothetical protein